MAAGGTRLRLFARTGPAGNVTKVPPVSQVSQSTSSCPNCRAAGNAIVTWLYCWNKFLSIFKRVSPKPAEST